MTTGAGPKTRIIPFSCPVVELKDLGDVLDFDKEGEVGEVYGLELDATGMYKRKVIDDMKDDSEKRYPKLGQLRDVTVPSPASDVHYYIKHLGNKWQIVPFPIPAPTIDWDIKFEFISPYVITESFKDTNFTFRKVLNSGPLLVSLVPNFLSQDNSRGDLKLKEFEKRRYLLTGKQGRNAPSVVFVPEDTVLIPPEATIVFEIVLRPPFTAREADIAQGVKLTWDITITQTTKVFIAIRKSTASVDVSTSNTAVQVTIDRPIFNQLSYISLTHIDLVSFYYVGKLYAVADLQVVIKD